MATRSTEPRPADWPQPYQLHWPGPDVVRISDEDGGAMIDPQRSDEGIAAVQPFYQAPDGSELFG